ncbi:hypothetical protein DNI29_21815 [Hymenobacter sediminis]|uniref:hypothetical protein n=1 Tax=Hymenobacter sediminis TaxID=2218621 RepID=UPI000DA669F1|nr:hypothetical protein [Hymenobacter sediminis]RPD44346.1 hypothetical protein DNI29_21815 [Hymenobacter sediminis]
MEIELFVEQITACRPTAEELRARYTDVDYEREVDRQFDVQVVKAGQPGRNQLETLLTGTTVSQLSIAGIQWSSAFEPLEAPGWEPMLQFASFREDYLCVSTDFRTLYYFDYHCLFQDTNNVVSWPYQDASFLEAVLFLLRVDTAFECRSQAPEPGAVRTLRDLLGAGSEQFA